MIQITVHFCVNNVCGVTEKKKTTFVSIIIVIPIIDTLEDPTTVCLCHYVHVHIQVCTCCVCVHVTLGIGNSVNFTTTML